MVFEFRYILYAFIIISLVLIISCDNETSPPTLPDLPAPPLPTNPTPADGSSDLDTTLCLNWELPDGDAYYAFDVYLGLDDDPTLVAEKITVSEYVVEGLNTDTSYYWRIDVRDISEQVTTGPVWSFTTYDGLILWEGFEGDFLPDNWGSYGEWFQAGDPYSGLYCAENVIQDKNPISYEDLYSPWIPNTFYDGKSLEISLYYRVAATSSYSYLSFSLQTDDEVSVLLSLVDVETDWTPFRHTIPCSDLGDEFRIIIRHGAHYGRSTAAIDDFSIREVGHVSSLD